MVVQNALGYRRCCNPNPGLTCAGTAIMIRLCLEVVVGPLGVQELIIIFIIALLVFGPRKLPELGKSLGRGLSEFRRASNELRNTLEEEVRAAEYEPPPKLDAPPADSPPTAQVGDKPQEKTSADAEQEVSPDPPETKASQESEASSASSPGLNSESKAEPKLDDH